MKHRTFRRVLSVILALLLVLAFTASAFAQGSTTTTGSSSTTTTGSSESSSAGEGQSGSEGSSEQDEQALAQKRELFTIMGLITVGAIIVGLRDKNRRR